MKKSTKKVSTSSIKPIVASTSVGKSMPINYNVILVVLLVVASFLVGRLTAQVEYLKNGGTTAVGGSGTAAAPVAAGQAGPSPIDVPGLKKIAKDLGLNQGNFDKCLDDGKYAKKVGDDLSYAGTVGVSGTPTFFINGVMLVGAQPQAKFEEVIEAELKDKSGDKVAGTEGRKDVNASGYVRGNKGTPVRIVEFSDFQCPYCVSAFPTVKAILAKYGTKVSLEYRHNPLSFHPQAQKAAEASECAGEQGKFWEMHDAMFESQS